MDDALWVGRDEVEGIPAESRKDVKPPPHWRLEAVAATERPRSLVLGPGPAAAPSSSRTARRPTSGCSTSPTPVAASALTTGRDPMPYWEDTGPQLSPDGTRVAYAEEGAVKLAPADGGPPRTLLAEAGSPALDRRRDAARLRRARRGRLEPARGDRRARRLAAAAGRHAAATTATSGAPPSRPTAREVAYVFTPRADLKRSEIRVADVATGAVRALTGTPGMADRGPQWSPDGADDRVRLGALGLVGGAPRRRRRERRAAAHDGRRPTGRSCAGTPTGTRLVGVRGEENAFALATVDVATGAVEELAPGGCWSAPDWTADGDVLAAFEGPGTPPELRLVTPGGADAVAPRAGAARRAARAAHRARAGLVPLARRARDPRLPLPAGQPRRGHAGAGGRAPARRADRRAHRGLGRPAAVLPRQGLRLAAGQLPRLDGLRPRLRAPQPRRLGRRGHVGLPRGRRLAARAGVGGRRPARDRRRLVRLLHGAPVGHRRPAAPLPLRRDGVRRLRHRHVVGAGRPRRRPGPRADDGQAVAGARGATAPARPCTASTRSPCRC